MGDQCPYLFVLACPADSRRRFNLNVLDYLKGKKDGFQGDFVVPPFEGDPQPESEPQIKTPEKRMVRQFVVCFLLQQIE